MTSKIRFITVFSMIMSLVCLFNASAIFYEDVKISYPDSAVNAYSVSYVGGKYYMSKAGGGLWYSNDAKTWSENKSRNDAYVISDLKQKSDSLVLFQGGFVLKSDDGVNFTNTMYLGENTVIHYDNGAYIAAAWRDSTRKNCYLFFSKDAENWIKVSDKFVSNSDFYMRPIGTSYLLNVHSFNNLMIDGEAKAVLVYPDSSFVICDYDFVTYNHDMGAYIAFKDNVLAVSKNPKTESFEPINTEGAGYVSFYKDKFYMVKGADMYLSSDGYNWQKTDEIYGYIDSYVDKDNAMIELYFRRAQSEVDGSLIVRKTYNPSKGWTQTEIFGANYDFERYGDTLSLVYTANGQRVQTGFISNDAVDFYQTDKTFTFASLNNYTKRGEYLFNPNIANTIYKVPTPAFDGIAKSGIEVVADGKYIAFDAPPVLMYDRTLVPVRGVCDAMDIDVSWDDKTRTVICSKNGNTLYLTVDSKDVGIKYFDGAEYNTQIEAPATIISDRTMIPIRILAETFNFSVDWDDAQSTVIIKSK